MTKRHTNRSRGYMCSNRPHPIIIIITIKGIYIAQVRKGHKCAMSAEMAVWLRNCLCLYSYVHVVDLVKKVKQKCLQMSSDTGRLFHATGPLTAKLLSP